MGSAVNPPHPFISAGAAIMLIEKEVFSVSVCAWVTWYLLRSLMTLQFGSQT